MSWKSLKLNVTFEQDEDGMWVAECPSIPGCVSEGKTKLQALGDIREAIVGCLEVRQSRGMPLTMTTPPGRAMDGALDFVEIQS